MATISSSWTKRRPRADGGQPDFPLFALAFCVFPKAAYVDEVTPALRRLKLATFDHDLVVLHEHDIRKKAGAFAMMSREPRETFLDALSRVIEAALSRLSRW